MIPTNSPRRHASLPMRRAVLVAVLLSLALLFGPLLSTVRAGETPVEPQAPRTLNQSDDHGHAEGDEHEQVPPTPEPAHDDGDGHHDATATAEPAHDDGDGHHAATPALQRSGSLWPTPTAAPAATPAQPHDNSDGHHDTPVPADDHGDGGSHGDDGHGEGTTDAHGEGDTHGESEGHGRAVPPPDPTTKKIVLSSFAVFNLGVVIVAAVLKRRMPQRKQRPARPS